MTPSIPEDQQVEAIFQLLDGSTFHAIEREWIVSDEGLESVKVRGWFESELPGPLESPTEPKGLYLQGTAIAWWQEPDQLTTVFEETYEPA